MDTVIADKAARKIFNEQWTPELLALFATDMGGEFQLRGSELSLLFDGAWVRCVTCKSVHRPVPGISHCLDCASSALLRSTRTTIPFSREERLLPAARHGGACEPSPQSQWRLIAAEHTAQLNAPQNEDVFSKAEEHELLFQDVAPALGKRAAARRRSTFSPARRRWKSASTSAQLSGVALRNMPPGRANYQQRAGRAGRRGNAVATVVAFGSADSHDEHYFSRTGRHDTRRCNGPKTYARQPRDYSPPHPCFPAAELPPGPHPGDRSGAAARFVFGSRHGCGISQRARQSSTSDDFKEWLAENEEALQERVASWIPSELSPEDRAALLAEMKDDCIGAIESAIRSRPEDGRRSPNPRRKMKPTEESPEEGEDEPVQSPDKRSTAGSPSLPRGLAALCFPN